MTFCNSTDNSEPIAIIAHKSKVLFENNYIRFEHILTFSLFSGDCGKNCSSFSWRLCIVVGLINSVRQYNRDSNDSMCFYFFAEHLIKDAKLHVIVIVVFDGCFAVDVHDFVAVNLIAIRMCLYIYYY